MNKPPFFPRSNGKVAGVPSATTVHPRSNGKIAPTSMDRSVSQAPDPADTVGAGQNRIKLSTYFTSAPVPGQGPQVIYNGDRMWAKITLVLETAGPVTVGESADLSPVLSGKGQLLETGVPLTYNIAKGNILYIAATGVNRVKLTVESYPWLETITGLLSSMIGAFRSAAAK